MLVCHTNGASSRELFLGVQSLSWQPKLQPILRVHLWFLVPNCLFRFSFYWLLFPILNSGHLVSEVAVGSRPSWKRIFICWKKIATGRSGRGRVGTACAFPGPGTYSPGLWLWDVHLRLCLSWDHPELLGQWPALPHQWNSIPHSPAFPPWPHVPSLWFHLLCLCWKTFWSLGSTSQSGPPCGEREQSNCPDVCCLPSPKN